MDTISYQEGAEFISALERVGFTQAHAKLATADPAVARQIVWLCNPGPITPVVTTNLFRAEAIMGNNYHDPAKWAKACGFRPSQAHKAVLGSVPFSAELLILFKETHILVPILPLNVMQLHGKFNGLFYQSGDPWYQAEAFATEQAEVGWMLIRREVVPGSTSRSWDSQQALIPEGEHVPTVAELVQALICHAVLTKERLLPAIWARTSSVDSDGYHVYLGYFGSQGLSVNDRWGSRQGSDIGLASSRKFKK